MVKEFSGSLDTLPFSDLWPIRRLLKDAIEEKAPKFSGRLLDYGCGSMPYKDLFDVREYVGADVWESGHPQDRKQADIFFDGLRVPVQDGSFDGLVAFEVLEHVPNLGQTVSEMVRLVKPGGLILITTPFCWPEHETPYDFARWTRFTLENVFEESGCEIVEFRKLGNSLTVIFQMFLLFACRKLSFPSIPLIGRVLRCFWCLILNFCALVTMHLGKGTDGLYLSSLVLVRKR